MIPGGPAPQDPVPARDSLRLAASTGGEGTAPARAAAPMGAAGTRTVALVVLSQVCQFLTISALALLLPLIREDLGISFTQAGLLSVAATLSYGLMQIPSGYLADRFGARQRGLDGIGRGTALAIGLSQAAALLPGISRSGATMSTGLALGLTRETAARFSFLLATPITLGAGIYGSRHLLGAAHTSTEWLAIGAGFAAAAISGAIAIGFLLRWLRTRSMTVFCLERVVLAGLVVVLLALGH